MPSIVSNLKKVKQGRHTIYQFGQIDEVMDVPYLLETQKRSYAEFLQKDFPRPSGRTSVFRRPSEASSPSRRRPTLVPRVRRIQLRRPEVLHPRVQPSAA